MKRSTKDEAVRFQRPACRLEERYAFDNAAMLQVRPHHGPATGQISSHTSILHLAADPPGFIDLAFLQIGENEVVEMKARRGYVAPTHRLDGFLCFGIASTLGVCPDQCVVRKQVGNVTT